jgi:hypothetical protein
MYTLLPVVANAEAFAHARVIDDRARYIKFMEAAEQYTLDMNLIVCNDDATRLILKSSTDPPGSDSKFYHYSFYSNHALKQARELANIMYSIDPDGLGHYATVLTKIPNKLMSVMVDGRELVTFTQLPKYRGVRMVDVIIPTRRPAQFLHNSQKQLMCVGAEMQLITIYASLCNPENSSSWCDILSDESRMRDIFKSEIVSKIDRASKKSETRGSGSKISVFMLDLIDTYSESAVIIGTIAADILVGDIDCTQHLQMIMEQDLKQIAEDIASSNNIEWKITNLKLPLDDRVEKLIVTHNNDIVEIYNIASFTPVPYTTHQYASSTVMVATPFAIAQFQLIDLWVSQVRAYTTKINRKRNKSTMSKIVADYYAAVAIFEKYTADKKYDMIFPLTSYFGQFADINITARRDGAASGKYYPPYMVAQRR